MGCYVDFLLTAQKSLFYFIFQRIYCPFWKTILWYKNFFEKLFMSENCYKSKPNLFWIYYSICIFCVSDMKLLFVWLLFVYLCNISSTSSFYFPTRPPLREEHWEFYFYDIYVFDKTRIFHERFKHFNVRLYAIFNEDTPVWPFCSLRFLVWIKAYIVKKFSKHVLRFLVWIKPYIVKKFSNHVLRFLVLIKAYIDKKVFLTLFHHR